MWIWALAGVWILGWLCIPQLLLLNKRPTATLAWLWAILLFPVVGPALYLMIGSERIKRARMKRRLVFRGKGHLTSSGKSARHGHTAARKDPLPPDAQLLFRSLSAITQLPLSTARSLRVLRKAP